MGKLSIIITIRRGTRGLKAKKSRGGFNNE